MLSFIVPAHNEEPSIAAVLDAIRVAADSLPEPYEMIVVDDASSDQTAAIAAAHGARVVAVELRQISAVRNAGAKVALGEIFFFVDADTLVNAAVLHAAVEVMRQGAIGGGAGLRFDEPTPIWVKLLLPGALWVGRQMRLAAGCFLFASKEAFFAAGGFSEAIYAGEEIVLSRQLGRLGRFVVVEEEVLTSGRKLRTYSGWDLLCLTGRMLRAGPGGLRSREGLGIWYGPRRPDRKPTE